MASVSTVFTGLVLVLVLALNSVTSLRVVCYYDSSSYWREGTAKMLPHDVEASLSYCTHIMYGHAKIDSSTYKAVPADEFLDLDPGKGNYKAITSLKKRFPGLHVLLSVGGGSDKSDIETHMSMLEESDRRKAFIDSARILARQYGFDGIDLALRFHEIYIKKDRGTVGGIWHKIKKTFGYAHSHKDEKEEEHRQGFTKLLKDMKSSLKTDGLLLSVTVIPNLNPESYFEVKSIESNLDMVNLIANDYKTPNRNPQEADYPAPLFAAGQRNKNETVDGSVQWWLNQGLQGSKINVGIPTFGRTWKLTSDSGITGVPPLPADGPGAEGPQTKAAGMLSFPEICAMIPTNQPKGTPNLLRRVTDPSQKLGTYAYRLPDAENQEGGMWVGYEDVDTVGYKASYVKNKGLGGVAISDISLDDFRGICNGDKFPLTKAARNIL